MVVGAIDLGVCGSCCYDMGRGFRGHLWYSHRYFGATILKAPKAKPVTRLDSRLLEAMEAEDAETVFGIMDDLSLKESSELFRGTPGTTGGALTFNHKQRIKDLQGKFMRRCKYLKLKIDRLSGSG